MKAIIAVNNLSVIGLNNQLPWKCKEDLQHFKKLTLNSILIAGYNTFQTLPILKDRVVYCDDKSNELIGVADWCIGGKKTYEKYCHLFTELHISHIDDNTIGDVMFPDLSNLNPECKIFNYYFKTNK